MPTFQYDFTHTNAFEKSTVQTGLFINGKFNESSAGDGKTIDVINPSTGETLGSVVEGTKEDVDLAVKAAQHAFDTAWGRE